MSAKKPTTRSYPGLFVVLEGIDGAGTTTQTERVARAVREDGYKVMTTRQPSDGPIGTLIRQALTGRFVLPEGAGPLNPQTLALLFAADRVDHLEAQILPALERGEIVICDRYVLSSLAYQGISLPTDWVQGINAFATPPDLTVFLQVDAAIAADRRADRGGNPELFEQDDQQERIAKEYQAAIRARKGDKLVKVDGTLTPEKVTEAILKTLRPMIKKAAQG